MNTAKLSRSGNQTKNPFSESWPPFFNKLPIWVKIMSYFFLIWIFNTIYLCLLSNNYLYGGHEGQNTRTFFGNHQICDLKCSVYPIFSPQMLCFVQSFILFLQNVWFFSEILNVVFHIFYPPIVDGFWRCYILWHFVLFSTVSFFKMCQVFVICCRFNPSGPPYAYFITLFYVLIILFVFALFWRRHRIYMLTTR